MSDIPEDIFAKARSLADDAANFGYTQAALDIAHALLAERERAAKIAEDFMWGIPMFVDMKINAATDDAACMVQEQIARAIRKSSS